MNGQSRNASHQRPAVWRAMADAVPTPMILISIETGKVLHSNRMGNFLADDPAAINSRPAGELFSTPISSAIEKMRRDGEHPRQTSVELPPAGHRGQEPSFWDIDYTPMPDLDREGAPAILLTAHEVTHHIRARQEAIAANEMHLHAVLHQIPAAILLVDSADGVASFRNDRLSQVLGYPELSLEEARQALRGRALHADGTEYRAEEYPSRRAFCDGETIEAEPMIYRHPDGRIVNLEMFAGPIRDATGRIIAAIAIVYDVTERKRQEAALHESQERLRIAVEAAGLATWDIDLIQDTTQVDSAFLRMVGMPGETFRASRAEIRSFVHPDDIEQLQANLSAAIAAKGQYQAEMRITAPDGRVLWLASSGRVVLDDAGEPKGLAGVVLDVTERRNREDALQAALAARELLLREADHRIKNSLHLICNILALQKTRLTSPDLALALDGAISRVQAVAEAHKALHQSTDLRTVNFATMLDDLCHHAGRLSPAIRFACACPEPIDLDTERAIPLGLIISELLTNAAKYAYGAEGGAVDVSAATHEGQIIIRVTDQGRGMPAEARDDGGIGSKLVTAIAKQIAATVETVSGPGGTEVTLTFASSAAIECRA